MALARPFPTIYSLLGVASPRSPPAPPTSPTSPDSVAEKHNSQSNVPPPRTFDPAHKYVTSPLFRNPFVFAALRLVTALYILVTLIIFLVRYAQRGEGDRFFAYFTNLTYVGLCAYFSASGVQTFLYALRWNRNGAGAGYPLRDSWPRILQALHVVLYSTIVTFPFIVTGVYWGLLDTNGVFTNADRAWTAVSVHLLNAILATCELVFSNSPPPPWIAMPFTVVFLGGYLGVAYITHSTQGFYTYPFLNPTIQSAGLLVAYVFGIAIGQCILFTLVHFIAKLREMLAIRFKRVIVLDAPLSSKSRRSSKGRQSGVSEATTEGGETRGVDGGEEEEYGEVEEWEPVQHPNMSRPEVDLEKQEGGVKK